MKTIQNFDELVAHLKQRPERKRIAVICATDESTQQAVLKALQEDIADAIFVGNTDVVKQNQDLLSFGERVQFIDADDNLDAARKAVLLVREEKADILMKGLVHSADVLRACLNKETGILPKGNVLTHTAVIQVEGFPRMLFYTDPAVIPFPTQEQRVQQVKYMAKLCRDFGIEQPKISLIHCAEDPDAKNFPYTIGYADIIKMAEAGEFGPCIVDGPLDVKTSCSKKSLDNKGIKSPLDGQADALIFPDIEAGNVFHKTVTLFCKATVACTLQGTSRPVVLPSRSDNAQSKFYSLCMAALQ